jgi:hypothetical protein
MNMIVVVPTILVAVAVLAVIAAVVVLVRGDEPWRKQSMTKKATPVQKRKQPAQSGKPDQPSKKAATPPRKQNAPSKSATTMPRMAPPESARTVDGLTPGRIVTVIAPGDDLNGRTGKIIKIIEDDEDDMDVFVQFADEADAVAFARHELKAEPSAPARRAPVQREPTKMTSKPMTPTTETPSAKKPSRKQDLWEKHPQLVERVDAPPGQRRPQTIQSWLQSIKDEGPHRIAKGGPRWVAGIAMVAAAAVLLLSTFLDWGRASTSNLTVTLSGTGSVTVSMPGGNSPSSALIAGGAIGVHAIVVSVIAAVAGGAYLWTRWRSYAALAVAVLGGIEFLVCLQNAITIASTLKPMVGAPGEYQIGIGLLLACASALVLSAVAVTAFVLERVSIGRAAAD